MAHTIGGVVFQLWDGPPPLFVQQQVTSHTRPGVEGVSQQNVGKWARQFEAVVTAHYVNYTTAVNAYFSLAAMPGDDPQIVIYNDINYWLTYGHLYTVDNVEPIRIRAAALLTGPGYFFYSGGEMVARLLMTPVVPPP